jgi:hypothetical protein
MRRTHLSLYYLICYLTPAGIALILAPQFTLKLLFSNGDYGDVFPRLAGTFALALAVLVIQIVRFRLEVLYTTILGVRAGMLIIFLALYFYSHDPLFITLLIVVGFGVALTSVSYWLDRQDRVASPRQAS